MTQTTTTTTITYEDKLGVKEMALEIAEMLDKAAFKKGIPYKVTYTEIVEKVFDTTYRDIARIQGMTTDRVEELQIIQYEYDEICDELPEEDRWFASKYQMANICENFIDHIHFKPIKLIPLAIRKAAMVLMIEEIAVLKNADAEQAEDTLACLTYEPAVGW